MQMRMIIGLIIASVISVHSLPVYAGDAQWQEYLDPDSYVSDAFAGREVPAVSTVWPDRALRDELAAILGHKPSLRFRYWGASGKTVWILDEVGKERPITAGIVVDQGKIDDIQVLVFRESRGWEVKYDFFTRQFAQLQLQPNRHLSASIDNITGATLSVKAMTRMARAALLLHQHSNQATQALADAR